jgi:hypothetical protein
MKKLFTVAAGFLFLSLLSCSTKINSRWQNNTETPQKYKKVLVLAIMNNKEKDLKLNLEKHIVGDLKFIGYNGVSALEELGPKFSRDVNEKEVVEKIKQADIDAVLTIVLLDKKKERFYVPARVQYSPYSIYNNQFEGYYRMMQSRVMSDGYYEEQTKYFLECNFYRVDSRKLLYSAQTTSFESGSIEALAHQYGRTVILDMVKRNIFLKPDESPLFQKSF